MSPVTSVTESSIRPFSSYELLQYASSFSSNTPNLCSIFIEGARYPIYYLPESFRCRYLLATRWNEVEGERIVHYRFGRSIVEEKGWTITAAVVDGKRGFINVFKGIPLQLCQFHQMKQVTKYLTRRPQTDAGKELRTLVLTLTKTDEATFTAALAAWHIKWGSFIEEKTTNSFVTGKHKWYYTHGKVRSAYRSLTHNLPYLFTYLKYPELNIPNTTNSLDGFFAQLKKKLGVHHGLRKDRRYKVISEILKGTKSRA